MWRISAFFIVIALIEVSFGRNLDTNPFIVGGVESDIARHPHHLALLDMLIGGPGSYL